MRPNASVPADRNDRAAATGVGQFLRENQLLLTRVAGILVIAFGLVIVADRRVSYGRVHPGHATEIFIRQALVEGDVHPGAERGAEEGVLLAVDLLPRDPVHVDGHDLAGVGRRECDALCNLLCVRNASASATRTHSARTSSTSRETPLAREAGDELQAMMAPLVAAVPALEPYAYQISISLVVTIITYLSLVVGELAPKYIAIQHAESLAVTFAPVMALIAGLLFSSIALLLIDADQDGYDAVQVAYGSRKPGRVNKPLAGHYAKAGVEAGRGLHEFRIDGGEAPSNSRPVTLLVIT